MTLPKSREAKKVNLDFNKEFISTFTQNIESGNVEFINQTLKDLHEADVANLIENAFQYSNLKPIGLHVNDQGLCVWDEGKPITSEERESIFKKGFRGTSSGNSPGTGLGLALGRQLAEGIGSKLELIVPPSEFDSKLPKTGNAFVIKIH